MKFICVLMASVVTILHHFFNFTDKKLHIHCKKNMRVIQVENKHSSEVFGVEEFYKYFLLFVMISIVGQLVQND